MSYRNLPTEGEALAALLRQILDDLERLKRGGAIAGRISLDHTITIGGIEVIVADAGNDVKTVTFRNPITGGVFDFPV